MPCGNDLILVLNQIKIDFESAAVSARYIDIVYQHLWMMTLPSNFFGNIGFGGSKAIVTKLPVMFSY